MFSPSHAINVPPHSPSFSTAVGVTSTIHCQIALPQLCNVAIHSGKFVRTQLNRAEPHPCNLATAVGVTSTIHFHNATAKITANFPSSTAMVSIVLAYSCISSRNFGPTCGIKSFVIQLISAPAQPETNPGNCDLPSSAPVSDIPCTKLPIARIASGRASPTQATIANAQSRNASVQLGKFSPNHV